MKSNVVNGEVIKITSEFSPNRKHPVLGTVRPHNGVDIGGLPVGTPILSPVAGRVELSAFSGSAGNWVGIVPSDDRSLLIIFMHLDKRMVEGGAMVEKGQQIGTLGNTGLSQSAHLHFEVRKNGKPIEPSSFLEIRD